jgi:hypothetical protein
MISPYIWLTSREGSDKINGRETLRGCEGNSKDNFLLLKLCNSIWSLSKSGDSFGVVFIYKEIHPYTTKIFARKMTGISANTRQFVPPIFELYRREEEMEFCEMDKRVA